MTVAVVERLEPVNVDHDQRKILSFAFGAPKFLRQRIVKGATVGEAG
jgi:hypothetical protein